MTPTLPPHIQAALAQQQTERNRAELKALRQQQVIAEQGIQALSSVAAELAQVNRATVPPATSAMLAPLVALVAIRLFELQYAHESNTERMAQLEGLLTKADSRIAVPNLKI